MTPKLFLAILWHQHQPLYADCLCPTSKGRFLFPWVRLHALRDYYSMAALLERHANVHLTCRDERRYSVLIKLSSKEKR